MKQYLDLVNNVLSNGQVRNDRTKTGTISLFGLLQRYNLNSGFPLVTTKKMFWKGIVHELIWFLKGQEDINYLIDNNVHIWNEWADEEGNVGPIYGCQWRNWPGRQESAYKIPDTIDQLEQVILSIKNNPHSRRHIVSAWNVSDLYKMALPPCHMFFQFYVNNEKELSCQLYQRSCDIALGVPFNIASYSLLTHIIAKKCDLNVGEFIHIMGDAHIYLNHVDKIKLQLERKPYDLPTIQLDDYIKTKKLEDIHFDDIKLNDYKCHGVIKFDISV